jgi:hypothetical protein
MNEINLGRYRLPPELRCDGAYTVNESVKIEHPKLVKLLQLAYSAEKAAAFAYIGHAGSVRNPDEKVAIKQIGLLTRICG